MCVELIKSMIEIWKFKKNFVWLFCEKIEKNEKRKKNILSVFGFEHLWIYHVYDILVSNQEFENGKNVGWIYFGENPKLGQIFKKNFKYF